MCLYVRRVCSVAGDKDKYIFHYHIFNELVIHTSVWSN